MVYERIGTLVMLVMLHTVCVTVWVRLAHFRYTHPGKYIAGCYTVLCTPVPVGTQTVVGDVGEE